MFFITVLNFKINNSIIITEMSTETKLLIVQGFVNTSENQLSVIIEPPKILPFSFGDEAVNTGELRQLLCTVIKGDDPLSISWSMKGENLGPGPDITTSQLGTRTSMLMISSVTYRHLGYYTCTATNLAGSASITAELKVNGNYCKEGTWLWSIYLFRVP